MVVQGGKTSENHDYIIIIRLTLATLAKSRALVHHGLVAVVVVAVGGVQKGSLLRSLGEEDNCVVVVHSQSLLTVFLAHVLYLQQKSCIFPCIYCTCICTRRNGQIIFWYVMYLLMLEDEIFHLKVEQSLGLGLGWGTYII